MSADAAPSLQDAQRAAEAVAHLDAGIVLLYGSIALGTATEDSDIDLCLVFDDLGDYSQRWPLATSAQSAVSAATGRPANIHVCDRPEWRALCECVSSFERHIASYAVVLRERPPREVDWDKQMPGPVTSAALAERMLHRADRPLWKLDFAMERCRDLHAEHAQDVGVMSPADTETQHRRLPGVRAEVCAAALEVIEVSLIAVNHSLPGPHLPKLALDVCGAVAAMPLRDAERASLQAALGGLDPRDVAVWRKVRWSDEDLLVEPWVHAMATPEHAHAMAQAAYSTAEAAAAIIEERLGETWASKELRSDLASQRRRDLLGSFAAFAGLPGPSPGLSIRLKRLWPFRRPRPRHRTPPSTTSAPRPETPR